MAVPSRHSARAAAMATTVMVVMVVGASSAGAQRVRPPASPFATAKSFTCSFPVFAAARWGTTPPETVSGTQEFTFRVEAIDYKKGQARIVASATVPVTVRLAETGLNVIEQTPIGNFILTTIFTAGGEGRTYRAVHSRHLGELTEAPRTSQSYGTCELAN